jgi:ribose transport system permease protein
MENSIKRRLLKFAENRYFSRLLLLLVLVILVVSFTILTSGRFVSEINLKIILIQALIIGTVATGGVYVFATGNVNLAMGASTVLTATLSLFVFKATNSMLLTIVFAVLLGMAIMAVSAALSTIFRIRVVFVTIVMLTLLSAIQQSILGGSDVSVPYQSIVQFQENQLALWLFLIFIALSILLFNFTNIGRSLKFIGTNQVSASQTGIEANNYLLKAFILSGVSVGLAAIMLITRTGSVTVTTLPSLNNDALLAIVLGGMSIFGGSKSYIYAGVIGALTVTALNNGLTMIGVDSTIIQGVRGLIFFALVIASQKRPKGLPVAEG